jgi:hypothetical protein
VVGDTVYGAAGQLTENTPPSGTATQRKNKEPERLRLGRNFLHAAELEFAHPITGKMLELKAQLPMELEAFLGKLERGAAGGGDLEPEAQLQKGAIAKMRKR